MRITIDCTADEAARLIEALLQKAPGAPYMDPRAEAIARSTTVEYVETGGRLKSD